MSQNNFEINPIGSIYKDNQKQIIEIDSKFRKGLKYISMFSHAIIIYKSDTQPNILNTNLCQKVVILKEVNEKQGNLVIEGLSEFDDKNILYDIKPYFPNEDRVKNATVPPNLNSDNTTLYNQSLSKLGTICKIKGNYYLEIPENFDNYVRVLQGYSHIKIIWWFNKFEKDIYKKTLECNPPYENAPKTGVFASRSPVRPNPLAMTTAKIISIDKELKRIKVSLLDCFDNTPLLGISPYIPKVDFVSEYRLPNWLKHWSEYLDDREFTITKEPLLLQSPSSILKKYMENDPKKNISKIDYFRIDKYQSVISDTGIIIKGARQNNLKNIDVTIPYGKTTVITGVSGSGKSSLAFDTIYAESQQRFFASMSLAERSHFSLLEKPKFDQISGLPPAIAISQQNINRNPRSTVGTTTDLYNLLRTLFAHIGVRHCPECGATIVKMTIEEIIEYLKNCKTGTIQKIKPFQAKEFEKTLIVSNRADTNYKDYVHSLDKTIGESIAKGMGAIQVQIDNEETLTFQTTEKCYHCDYILFQMTAADFSFNNPESMCPVCNGLGTIMDIDTSLIIKNPDKSLLDNASTFWGDLRKFQKSPNANWMKGEILALAQDMNVNLETTWENLPKNFKTQAIYGSGTRKVTFSYKNKNGRTGSITRPVEGAYNILKRLLKSTNSENQKSLAAEFMISKPCDCCRGERLKLESRLVTIADTRFPEVINMSITELQNWITLLPNSLSNAETVISHSILRELYIKLSDYIKIGLGYLTLDRAIPTLSGGEWQRLQLVSQLSSGLSNILYILDEPTKGLHPKDYTKLMEIINKLKELHNTIIIVEHAPAIMLAADNIIDIGGGAGVFGGYLIAQGTPEEILKNKHSETGLYLSGKNILNLDYKSDINNRSKWIALNGVNGNNLQNIDIKFPTNAITCITGVSGSGKSSLVNYGILPSIQSCIDKSSKPNKKYKEIFGAENINKIVHITQKPIGRSSRSTPATYTGIMDEIRPLFARTKAAMQLGYSQSKFSYNSKEGQCPVCHGYGYKTLEAAFMPSTKIECPLCKGQKFHASTLQILYRGKNIAQVLDMSVSEALDFFKENKKLRNILQVLNEIGLGYITLGQSSQTLSGGESQRIKLATELNLNTTNNTLYLLDEPTTGLHFSDIQNLLNILGKITGNGNTVILVEHNLDVIKNADWIIDLGPEGGAHGGKLMIQGTVLNIMKCSSSHTGKLLKNRELSYTLLS